MGILPNKRQNICVFYRTIYEYPQFHNYENCKMYSKYWKLCMYGQYRTDMKLKL